jgi:hypothetical protein
MSDALHQDDTPDLWQPPATFRETLADAERVAGLLVEQLATEPCLLVPVDRLEFLVRRLHRLTRGAHLALPPEVS